MIYASRRAVNPWQVAAVNAVRALSGNFN